MTRQRRSRWQRWREAPSAGYPNRSTIPAAQQGGIQFQYSGVFQSTTSCAKPKRGNFTKSRFCQSPSVRSRTGHNWSCRQSSSVRLPCSTIEAGYSVVSRGEGLYRLRVLLCRGNVDPDDCWKLDAESIRCRGRSGLTFPIIVPRPKNTTAQLVQRLLAVKLRRGSDLLEMIGPSLICVSYLAGCDR
jgi:hypothetical protein